MNIKQLYKVPTATVGALPMTNYFDVYSGYKKCLSDWNYFYQEEFDYDAALVVECEKQVKEIFDEYMKMVDPLIGESKKKNETIGNQLNELLEEMKVKEKEVKVMNYDDEERKTALLIIKDSSIDCYGEKLWLNDWFTNNPQDKLLL